jgi:prepilin-type N-terminal cleavage/methylation domain-containing protein/prepilin-type processing-associated H-X9-DG protein
MRPRRRAFSLLELLCVIAVIAIVAGILFPVFWNAREKARQTRCLVNLRQIGVALRLYAEDHDGVSTAAIYQERRGAPHLGFWYDAIQPYVRSREILLCPSDRDRGRRPSSYAWPFPHHAYRYTQPDEPRVGNPAAFSLDWWERPAEVMGITESVFAWPERFVFSQFVGCPVADRERHVPAHRSNGYTPYSNVDDRHAGGVHALFLDGHAAWRHRDRLLAQGADARAHWGHDADVSN